VEGGAELESMADNGRAPLSRVAGYGYKGAVRLLMLKTCEKGDRADVASVSESGWGWVSASRV
jgi:hypothetical protein